MRVATDSWLPWLTPARRELGPDPSATSAMSLMSESEANIRNSAECLWLPGFRRSERLWRVESV